MIGGQQLFESEFESESEVESEGPVTSADVKLGTRSRLPPLSDRAAGRPIRG